MVRAVKDPRFLGCAVAASALSYLTACGSSSNETAGGDAGAEKAKAPEAGEADAAPIDKTPITGLSEMTWKFVPVEGAICRDGSPTGIGVSINPNSKNLMIFLEGGGACFNSVTCGGNASSFSKSGFDACVGAGSGTCAALSLANGGGGVFNRSDMHNPMADWNFVYVPFCTGDVHAGNKTNVTVPGVPGKQQFVGYVDMTRYLARIVPTFPAVTKVLLTGGSAGGFGAAANYLQTAKAFGSVPVYELDDSGPPMEDPFVPKCLQQKWSELWGFDKTILADCGSDCPDPTNYSLDASIHVAKLYPKIPFGLVEDTDDMVITFFYGYGNNNCADVSIPTALTGPMFTAGLLDSRMKLAAYPNFGGFIFDGSDHTTLGGAQFDTRTAGGGDAATVNLYDWVSTLVNNGTVTNVGP
jgi:hypothetical protein